MQQQLLRAKQQTNTQDLYWKCKLLNNRAEGRAGRLGVISGREAVCPLQRSCDLPHCQVRRHTKSCWTWLNQETITCHANWVWKGLHRPQGVSLSVPFKIERFLLLASSSIAGENSVTTGPCQQHRLTSEHGCVPCTDKNLNIWCLLFSSFHAILSFSVEKKLQHPKDQNICTKHTQFWLSYIRLVATTLVQYDNVCHQMM